MVLLPHEIAVKRWLEKARISFDVRSALSFARSNWPRSKRWVSSVASSRRSMPLMPTADISFSHRRVSEFQSWEKPFNACLKSDGVLTVSFLLLIGFSFGVVWCCWEQPKNGGSQCQWGNCAVHKKSGIALGFLLLSSGLSRGLLCRCFLLFGWRSLGFFGGCFLVF